MIYLRTTKKQALNAINTSYEQCKKGWEYLNEMRKREGLKPVQWSDDAYNKTLRQYTIVAQNVLHLGNHGLLLVILYLKWKFSVCNRSFYI